MEITIKGRHWKPTASFRAFAVARLQKLDRFYPSLIRAELTVTKEGYRHEAEVRLHGNAVDLLTKATDADPMTAVDLVLAKQEKALARHKDRLKDRKKRVPMLRAEPASEAARLLPRVTVKPAVSLVRTKARRVTMSADQAARALLKSRKPLLVFEERGGNGLCVAYRLADGEVGLLELE
jgi:putative sigma-54 modulation protein